MQSLPSPSAGIGVGRMLEQPLLFLSLPFGVALATHILASVSLGASLILRVPDRVAQVAPGMLTAGLGLYSWSRKEFGQVHAPLHRDRRGYWLGGAVLVLVGRDPLGLVAGPVAGFPAGRLSRCPPGHRQGQPLDQAGFRDRQSGGGHQADYRLNHARNQAP